MATTRALQIPVGAESVSALYQRPRGASSLYLLAHGAGAGMAHPFLDAVCAALADRGTATLRFHFPYMEARASGHRPPPNRAPVLQATVAAAARRARRLARGIPLFAGGKSMGGRMTSMAAAASLLPDLRGIAFLGFPLHPPKLPAKAAERAAHLAALELPLLFIQGTRDPLAPLAKMRKLTRSLGPAASLHVVRDADHGFAVRVRSGRTGREVIDEIAATLAAWMARH